MTKQKKPIIATNIDGFLIKREAFWGGPHRIGFDRLIMLTKDPSLKQWVGKPDYFKGVDIAMKKIMPDATDEERTAQVRKWYQEDVVFYIKENPQVVFKEVVEKLKELKNTGKYILALVTLNSKEYIEEILDAAGLKGVYDIIFATNLEDKPKKEDLFQNFINNYGKPIVYIAGKNGETFDKMLNLGVITLYATWDKFDEEIAKRADKMASNPEELYEIISQLPKP